MSTRRERRAAAATATGGGDAEGEARARARRNAWLLAAFVVACYLGYIGWSVLRAFAG